MRCANHGDVNDVGVGELVKGMGWQMSEQGDAW